MVEIERARQRHGALVVGSDFAGTLAPIVEDPAAVAMTPKAKQALDALLEAHVPVCIASGRVLDDLALRIECRTR